ncbi:DUF1080 domain-containing protein [Segetibacter sp.]|jgi:hypothetical protein|uniref:3-keto-disaccharide hydrolase n=1 Tax=Segetibacter sp. TaxID=2231182 RepID=UPI0026294245|nr:DUF1080 domain-containing protein [Segetibacter sp.]MCW3082586.1 hypothetical protein [Segetibacter sp.]
MKQNILVIGVVISVIILSSYTYMAAKDNTLTPSEKKTGWKLLFDGKSMNGWRAYQNKQTNSWSVKDGVMYCKGSSTDKSDLRADMITDKQYENFDLSIDWKISPQGNSGILYLATEEFKAAYLSGPEYQIIDDLNFPQKLEDWQKTGANYAMDPAPTAAPNPVGQWNTTRIVVNKGHVQHWLNGKKLLDFEMWTDEWKKKKTEGKWKDAPGYGVSKKGHIGLQDHGSEAWFKNLKIKEL